MQESPDWLAKFALSSEVIAPLEIEKLLIADLLQDKRQTRLAALQYFQHHNPVDYFAQYPARVVALVRRSSTGFVLIDKAKIVQVAQELGAKHVTCEIFTPDQIAAELVMPVKDVERLLFRSVAHLTSSAAWQDYCVLRSEFGLKEYLNQPISESAAPLTIPR